MIKKYSDISASLNGGSNSMGWTNTMLRSNALPIDSKSIFNSRKDAISYLSSSNLAYEGLIIAIKDENDTPFAYVVDPTKPDGLQLIGSEIIGQMTLLSVGGQFIDQLTSISYERHIRQNTDPNGISVYSDVYALPEKTYVSSDPTIVFTWPRKNGQIALVNDISGSILISSIDCGNAFN